MLQRRHCPLYPFYCVQYQISIKRDEDEEGIVIKEGLGSRVLGIVVKEGRVVRWMWSAF